MRFANQTEFFLSEHCVPRHIRLRSRQRFDALQKERESIVLLNKFVEGDDEYKELIAYNKARLSEIDKELSELCNYIVD